MFNDSHWIQTFTGKKFYPCQPRPEDICIEDIAHSLARICRFTGHIKSNKIYSVAQHSVMVSRICKSAKHGLLHDASESVTNDLSSPLKRSGRVPDFIAIEKKNQSMIYAKYGLAPVEPADVKEADLIMLATEAVNLMSPLHPEWHLPATPLPKKLEVWDIEESETKFLERFHELFQV